MGFTHATQIAPLIDLHLEKQKVAKVSKATATRHLADVSLVLRNLLWSEAWRDS